MTYMKMGYMGELPLPFITSGIRTAIVLMLPEAFQREKINSVPFNSLASTLEHPHMGFFYFASSNGRRVSDSEFIGGGSVFPGVMGRESTLVKEKTFLVKLMVALFPNISVPFIAV